MREILFRGKEKETKEWVEGYFLPFDDYCCIVTDPDIDLNYEVIPKTICQYTGLTDKNGRKIFEGDILKSDLGKTGRISFNESHMAFMILALKENKYYYVDECSGNHMEVIGNIFDNPDLCE